MGFRGLTGRQGRKFLFTAQDDFHRPAGLIRQKDGDEFIAVGVQTRTERSPQGGNNDPAFFPLETHIPEGLIEIVLGQKRDLGFGADDQVALEIKLRNAAGGPHAGLLYQRCCIMFLHHISGFIPGL